MNKILAMIITYNPDIELLEMNISNVLNQVDKLIIYDNASHNYDNLQALIDVKYTGGV